MTDPRNQQVQHLILKLMPHLFGQGGDVQGAALAELTSMWLSGHVVVNDGSGQIDVERTKDARDAIMEVWLNTMRELTEFYTKDTVTKLAEMQKEGKSE
jgi:hypothetical protein